MDKDILANLMKRFPMKVLPNGNIRTCPVRISFPVLTKPKKSQDGKGEPKYEVSLLFPKGADLSVLVDATKAKAIEAHGPKALELVAAKKISWPLIDQGERTDKEGKVYAGYEPGAKTCSIRSTTQPRCKDQKAQDITPDQIYAGCWALVTVNPFAGTWKGEDGITKRYVSIGLNNIQFLADDERFGGGASDPDDEFEAIDGTTDGAAAFAGAEPSGSTASGYDFG